MAVANGVGVFLYSFIKRLYLLKLELRDRLSGCNLEIPCDKNLSC